jgi:hypothetical protein
MVATKSPVKRILAALGALDAADAPMSRLQAARRLREAAEQLEAAQVAAARKAGATWIDIGACYGLTKQGAQQRFRRTRNQAKAGRSRGDRNDAACAAAHPAQRGGQEEPPDLTGQGARPVEG